MTYQNRIKYISMVLVIAAAISVVLLQRNAPKVYEGIGEGFENEIRVQVTAYRNRENEIRITDIQVEHEDTPEVGGMRSEEHTSELQSRQYLVCRLLLEKKKKTKLLLYIYQQPSP